MKQTMLCSWVHVITAVYSYVFLFQDTPSSTSKSAKSSAFSRSPPPLFEDDDDDTNWI